MSRMTTDELLARYPHYYKDVRHLEVVDIYRILDLFGVTDPTVQHAVKKLLIPGKRSGGKAVDKDLMEAVHTLERGHLMREEDAKKGLLNTTVTVNIVNSGVVPKEHAERIAEHYMAPTPSPAPVPAEPPRDVNKCAVVGCSARRELSSCWCLAHTPAPPQPVPFEPKTPWEQTKAPQPAPMPPSNAKPPAPTEDVGMPMAPTSWKPMEPLKPLNPDDYTAPPPPPAPMPVDVCMASPQLPVETPNLPVPELPVDGLALAVHNGVNAGVPGKLPRL